MATDLFKPESGVIVKKKKVIIAFPLFSITMECYNIDFHYFKYSVGKQGKGGTVYTSWPAFGFVNSFSLKVR